MKSAKVVLKLSACVVVAVAGAAMGQTNTTGPSSSQDPYMRGVVAGVNTVSLLTVGDSIGGYRMGGIPDGIGAFDNGDGSFTLMMSHELTSTSGIVRAHGQRGALDIGQHELGVLEKGLARRCRGHAPAGAKQQTHTELFLGHFNYTPRNRRNIAICR